ncbi:MAG: protein BatD [bacterium]|nr:protein BatD [bacterium]
MARALLALLWLTSTVFAQVQFTARANRTSVPVGEPVEVTFTVEGAASGVPTPQPQTLTNLKLVGGPSTSTQTSIVNGRMSSSKSFTFFVSGVAPGPATIGPVEIEVKGRRYATAPISLTIVAAGSRARPADAKEDVFVQVIPDQREAFVGEQIILTYKLYFSANIFAPEIKELPKATGFWTEEFDLPDQLVPRDEVVEGQSYKSIVFRKVALFATTSGELTIDPLTAVVQVERQQKSKRGRDPFFDDPFFSFGRRREAVEVSTRPLKLSIKALPEADKPAGDIAVGKYSASARVDKQQVLANDAITLTIQLRGAGNIKMLPAPVISFPADFETFEPKTTDQVKRGPDRITGSKTFEYVLLPRAACSQVIPSLSYYCFNPETKSYETVSTPPISIDVGRGSVRGAENTLPFEAKREVKTVGQDIAFAKANPGVFTTLHVLPHQQTVFWLMLGTPWLALAGLAVAMRRRDKVGKTIPSRRRRALRQARAHLLSAETASAKGNHSEATRLLTVAVQNVLVEWTSLSASTHTTSDWEAEWLVRGQTREQWMVLKSALELSDRSRFAGGTQSNQDLAQIVTNVRSVLDTLERAS